MSVRSARATLSWWRKFLPVSRIYRCKGGEQVCKKVSIKTSEEALGCGSGEDVREMLVIGHPRLLLCSPHVSKRGIRCVRELALVLLIITVDSTTVKLVQTNVLFARKVGPTVKRDVTSSAISKEKVKRSCELRGRYVKSGVMLNSGGLFATCRVPKVLLWLKAELEQVDKPREYKDPWLQWDANPAEGRDDDVTPQRENIVR
ncbi:hypothetical protein BKA83DRAFT_4128795 [Pisolithus microcarpus]|nr:hypothetical protein BKA83DRAFT_4128795 [Pisolithus microcarpus]